MLTAEQERLRDEITAIVDRHGRDRSNLIPILQDVKRAYHARRRHGHAGHRRPRRDPPRRGLQRRLLLRLPARRPRGRVRRAPLRHALVRLRRQERRRRGAAGRRSGVDFDETTDDGLFTLEWASCVGMCDQGPALLVNDQVHTRVTPDDARAIVADCRQAG